MGPPRPGNGQTENLDQVGKPRCKRKTTGCCYPSAHPQSGRGYGGHSAGQPEREVKVRRQAKLAGSCDQRSLVVGFESANGRHDPQGCMTFVHEDEGVYRASVCGVFKDILSTGFARGTKKAHSSPSDEFVRIVELASVLFRYVGQSYYMVAIAYRWRSAVGDTWSGKRSARLRRSNRVVTRLQPSSIHQRNGAAGAQQPSGQDHKNHFRP
eukprot:638363-Pleurochrysis_carterae.AAC.3